MRRSIVHLNSDSLLEEVVVLIMCVGSSFHSVWSSLSAGYKSWFYGLRYIYEAQDETKQEPTENLCSRSHVLRFTFARFWTERLLVEKKRDLVLIIIVMPQREPSRRMRKFKHTRFHQASEAISTYWPHQGVNGEYRGILWRTSIKRVQNPFSRKNKFSDEDEEEEYTTTLNKQNQRICARSLVKGTPNERWELMIELAHQCV